MVKTDAALRAALLSLLEREPFDKITVRMICADADINYTTFFRRYPSKEALLDYVAAGEIASLIEQTVPILEVSSEAAFLGLCRYVEDNRALWTVLLTGGARNTMRDELLKVSVQVASEAGAPNDWLPMDLATHFTSLVQIEVIAWWLKQPPERFTVEEMAKILHRLVLAPSWLPGTL
jgi:AcrR family transcriptional regulator